MKWFSCCRSSTAVEVIPPAASSDMSPGARGSSSSPVAGAPTSAKPAGRKPETAMLGARTTVPAAKPAVSLAPVPPSQRSQPAASIASVDLYEADLGSETGESVDEAFYSASAGDEPQLPTLPVPEDFASLADTEIKIGNMLSLFGLHPRCTRGFGASMAATFRPVTVRVPAPDAQEVIIASEGGVMTAQASGKRNAEDGHLRMQNVSVKLTDPLSLPNPKRIDGTKGLVEHITDSLLDWLMDVSFGGLSLGADGRMRFRNSEVEIGVPLFGDLRFNLERMMSGGQVFGDIDTDLTHVFEGLQQWWRHRDPSRSTLNPRLIERLQLLEQWYLPLSELVEEATLQINVMIDGGATTARAAAAAGVGAGAGMDLGGDAKPNAAASAGGFGWCTGSESYQAALSRPGEPTCLSFRLKLRTEPEARAIRVERLELRAPGFKISNPGRLVFAPGAGLAPWTESERLPDTGPAVASTAAANAKAAKARAANTKAGAESVAAAGEAADTSSNVKSASESPAAMLQAVLDNLRWDGTLEAQLDDLGSGVLMPSGDPMDARVAVDRSGFRSSGVVGWRGHGNRRRFVGTLAARFENDSARPLFLVPGDPSLRVERQRTTLHSDQVTFDRPGRGLQLRSLETKIEMGGGAFDYDLVPPFPPASPSDVSTSD